MTETPAPNPSPWPRRAALAAALGALVLVFEVLPRAAEAVRLFSAWRAEAALLDGGDPAVEQIRLEAERDRLARESGAALVRLPESGELSAVLDGVAAAADSAGVVVVAVEPGPPVPTSGFETVPIRVSVRGGGHGIGRFVDAIEGGPGLLRVRALAVAGPGLVGGPATAHVDLDALRAGDGG